MEPKIPPLNLLRVFEVAGRHLSFKEAARELHVTPSAVSHQIKSLEAQLGFSLFRRHNRVLTLTRAGQDLLASVSQHLNALRKDTGRIIRRHGNPSVRAHILPFMASEYVIPNLHDFQQQHPDVELRIETSANALDFELHDIDIGVRLGLGKWPGLVAEKLVCIEATPVCSPGFQAKHNMKEISDLKGKTLIQIQWQEDPWQRWSDRTGTDLETTHKLTLDSFVNTLTAAEQGLGVSLALFPLAYKWVEQGRLVTPFRERIPVEEGYYLVYRPEDQQRDDLQRFVRWLVTLFNRLDDNYHRSPVSGE
ncbi:MAG: LysR substrate-binding domain-containing protein [Ketobacteraceae bacterium]|nr:LysR substrate-binding domain-containing protein [Ketobacteraceae bacterium]